MAHLVVVNFLAVPQKIPILLMSSRPRTRGPPQIQSWEQFFSKLGPKPKVKATDLELIH